MKLKKLLVVVLPPLVTEIGSGIREYIHWKREAEAPCKHGRPAGRLCGKCYDEAEDPDRTPAKKDGAEC